MNLETTAKRKKVENIPIFEVTLRTPPSQQIEIESFGKENRNNTNKYSKNGFYTK